MSLPLHRDVIGMRILPHCESNCDSSLVVMELASVAFPIGPKFQTGETRYRVYPLPSLLFLTLAKCPCHFFLVIPGILVFAFAPPRRAAGRSAHRRLLRGFGPHQCAGGLKSRFRVAAAG
jgi:hypothetical protein